MLWTTLATWLEIAGGSRALPESWKSRKDVAVLRAALWVLLLLMALAFAGRNTKFIYVDF
jgi:hypothetical protein